MDATCNKQYINHELYNTPFFINNALTDKNNPNPNNRLILFECRGSGPPSNSRTDSYYNPNHLSLITLSSTQNLILIGSSDQGLVPPSKNVISLDDVRHKNIIMSYMNHYNNDNCSDATIIEKKEFFISFVGNTKRSKKKIKIGDIIRQELLQYHNMSENILITDTKHKKKYTSLSYLDIMLSSEYCLIPRGENLFSYRFTEVLSTGCIPVIISNEKWLLPFIQPQIVNWNECVIYMNYTDISNMITKLKSISYQQLCIMHYKCYYIYSKDMSNTNQIIHGIMNGIESLVE